MRIEPLSNFVIIEAIEQDKTTDAGIILPDTIGEPSSVQGTIVAVGPGTSSSKPQCLSRTNPDKSQYWPTKPTSVRVGDRVLFRRQRFEKVQLDGKEVYLGNEENIWAKIIE